MNPAVQARTRSGRAAWILGGVLLYLLFLILQMPVAWLIARLPADVPVQLRQASGTPWQGAVRQVIWQADVDRIDVGSFAWRWRPGELLNGRVGFNFELKKSANQLSGVVLLARNSLALNNVRGQVDAALLGFASRPLGLLQPQGTLGLDVADLFLTRKRIHGAVRLDWRNARSGMVAAPLGDYRAELKSAPDGRRARVDVLTLQGPLAMTGHAEYLPGQVPQGTLRLTPPLDASGKVYRPLLDILGRPNAGGTWVLFFNPH